MWFELIGKFLESKKSLEGNPFPGEYSELGFLWDAFSRTVEASLSPVPSLLSKFFSHKPGGVILLPGFTLELTKEL